MSERAAKVVALETRMDRLWQAYRDAATRAQGPDGTLEDAMAAGRAWSAILHEFEPKDGAG